MVLDDSLQGRGVAAESDEVPCEAAQRLRYQIREIAQSIRAISKSGDVNDAQMRQIGRINANITSLEALTAEILDASGSVARQPGL